MHLSIRLVIAVCAILWSFSSTPGQAAGRVALLIANSRYDAVSSLANPRNDVGLIAASLRSVGFTSVVVANDLDKAGMDAALLKFGQVAEGAEMAVVYYAGHGIEIGGRNFLIPTNARLVRDRDADFEAVALDNVLRIIESAAFKLVILDACRNNPFAVQMTVSGQGRSVGRGLAKIEPEGETLVVYATKAGAFALDGDGSNSPFALSLSQRLIEPGVEIRLMLGRVRDDVMLATKRQQEPFSYGSLSGTERYLAGRAKAGGTISTVAFDPVQIEALVWQGALSANTKPAFEDYLARYASGIFAGQAKANLAKLNVAAAPATAALSQLPRPAPIPAAQTNAAFVAALRREPAARVYANRIAPECRLAVQDRYPFFSNSVSDITLTDMTRTFGYGGLFSQFIEQKLSAQIDRNGPVWRWRETPANAVFDPATPEQMEKSVQIEKLVTGGYRFAIALERLSPDFDAVEFSNGGVTSRFTAVGGSPVPFVWALQGLPSANVVFYAKGQKISRIDTTGQWALFRLIDKARRENVGPQQIRVVFGVADKSATFRITLAGDTNPFSRGGIWSFRCPQTL